MNNRFEDREHETEERRTAALIGLIIVLMLAIAGVILVRGLVREFEARGLFDVGTDQLRADRGSAAALALAAPPATFRPRRFGRGLRGHDSSEAIEFVYDRRALT